MKRLLLPLMAALALPTTVNANERVSSEMSKIEAQEITSINWGAKKDDFKVEKVVD